MPADAMPIPQLEGGERLVWTGRPDPLGYAWYKGKSRALPGLMMLLAGIFFARLLWMMWDGPRLPDLDGSDWWNRMLMGGSVAIIFVIALATVLSPIVFMFEALRTRYLLTNRRAIISVSSPFTRRQSFPLATLPFIELMPSGEDRGHVLFASVTPVSKYAPAKDGFLAVSGARRIAPLLRSRLGGTP